VAHVTFNPSSRKSEASMNSNASTLKAVDEGPTTAELEIENARLQRLVAALLMRNQQLRVELKSAQRALTH
jgi:hypothetical protein